MNDESTNTPRHHDHDRLNADDVDEPLPMWQQLGAIAHGPLVLARVPGITVALRCIFAYPQGLGVWLVARGETALVPRTPPPGSEAEAREQSERRQAGHEPHDEPVLHATLDGIRQEQLPSERKEGLTVTEESFRRVSCLLRVLGLPRDGRVTFDVSWAPALATTSTTVHLPDLARTAASAVPLVRL